MSQLTDHPLWLRGIAEFNRHEFFQCHESWELLWRELQGSERLFCKGLIQAAVALFHLRRGNDHGAAKLLAGAERYLAPYRPVYAQFDVEVFLAELSGCICQTLSVGEGHGRPRGALRQIPQIRWPSVAESVPGVR